MLARAWGLLGGVSAALVMMIFLATLRVGGWRVGADVSSGPLHHVWQQATTMSFLGIVACQIGTAMAARTQHASLLQAGVFTNRLLLWGFAYEVVFAAAIVSVPSLQAVFGTATPSLWQVLMILPFPLIVWGVDELWRWNNRRRTVPKLRAPTTTVSARSDALINATAGSSKRLVPGHGQVWIRPAGTGNGVFASSCG